MGANVTLPDDIRAELARALPCICKDRCDSPSCPAWAREFVLPLIERLVQKHDFYRDGWDRCLEVKAELEANLERLVRERSAVRRLLADEASQRGALEAQLAAAEAELHEWRQTVRARHGACASKNWT
jgi:hypothetical protein